MISSAAAQAIMKPRIVGSNSIAAPAPTKRITGVMLSASARTARTCSQPQDAERVERIVSSWITAKTSV
ncbi:hypothetical protein QP185_04390 [Sphingomonas aerolata]|uniref:hypothetical protein n=1 Tax=Sphingomonas aerolata TaxID=185951 RepID=UPI002FE12655